MEKQIELIQKTDGGTWSVRYVRPESTIYDDELSFDEALGCVAAIMFGQEPRYLRTTEYWDDWNKKYGWSR